MKRNGYKDLQILTLMLLHIIFTISPFKPWRQALDCSLFHRKVHNLYIFFGPSSVSRLLLNDMNYRAPALYLGVHMFSSQNGG